MRKLTPALSVVALSLVFLMAASVPASTKKETPMKSLKGSAEFQKMEGTDGLQFRDDKIGTGKVASPGQMIEVNYTGWLLDANAKDSKGKQFDSSIGRDTFKFKLGGGQVIQGWDKGFANMKEGGKRTLQIPAKMAYGAQGAGGGLIPPNATLLFDVELIKVMQ